MKMPTLVLLASIAAIAAEPDYHSHANFEQVRDERREAVDLRFDVARRRRGIGGRSDEAG